MSNVYSYTIPANFILIPVLARGVEDPAYFKVDRWREEVVP